MITLNSYRNMNNRIIFLTETNGKIGVGHFMRTIRMSKKIYGSKNQILIILKSSKKSIKHKTFNKIYYLSKFSEIYNIILKLKPNLLIIDLAKPNLNFEKKLYYKKINFLIYDRLLRKKIYSNYCINLHPEIKLKDYEKRIVKKTKFFLGPKYFPINCNFKKKKILYKIKNIFIFLGGGNNDYILINKIFKIIYYSKLKNCKINFISVEEIKKSTQNELKQKNNLNIKFINNSDKIYNFIKKADLSIISSGSIAFESCFFNVPMILISVAENQIKIAKAWNKLNVGYFIGKSDAKNFSFKLNKAINLLYNFEDRSIMSKKQKKIFNFKKSNNFKLTNLMR